MKVVFDERREKTFYFERYSVLFVKKEFKIEKGLKIDFSQERPQIEDTEEVEWRHGHLLTLRPYLVDQHTPKHPGPTPGKPPHTETWRPTY